MTPLHFRYDSFVGRPRDGAKRFQLTGSQIGDRTGECSVQCSEAIRVGQCAVPEAPYDFLGFPFIDFHFSSHSSLNAEQ